MEGPKTSPVHDDLARLMVSHFRQGLAKSEKLLQVCTLTHNKNEKWLTPPSLSQHVWFFLEVMLKSMAQFLAMTNKMQVHVKHNCVLPVL